MQCRLALHVKVMEALGPRISWPNFDQVHPCCWRARPDFKQMHPSKSRKSGIQIHRSLHLIIVKFFLQHSLVTGLAWLKLLTLGFKSSLRQMGSIWYRALS